MQAEVGRRASGIAIGQGETQSLRDHKSTTRIDANDNVVSLDQFRARKAQRKAVFTGRSRQGLIAA